jgi:hypothetical protein
MKESNSQHTCYSIIYTMYLYYYQSYNIDNRFPDIGLSSPGQPITVTMAMTEGCCQGLFSKQKSDYLPSEHL